MRWCSLTPHRSPSLQPPQREKEPIKGLSLQCHLRVAFLDLANAF
jgi:hypothetical protein